MGPHPPRSRFLDRTLDDGFDFIVPHVAAPELAVTADTFEPAPREVPLDRLCREPIDRRAFGCGDLLHAFVNVSSGTAIFLLEIMASLKYTHARGAGIGVLFRLIPPRSAAAGT